MSVNNISYEYECRAMLSEKEYLNLLDFYHPITLITNVNHYFDTPDLFLTNNHMVLRLREVDDKKELTLKIKERDADIEITALIDAKDSFIKHPIIEDKEIRDELINRCVDIGSLQYITTLKTERFEISKNKYLIVLDKNYYHDKIDFNIEIESMSRKEAKKRLLKILKAFNLSYEEDYISKSRRAILKL